MRVYSKKIAAVITVLCVLGTLLQGVGASADQGFQSYSGTRMRDQETRLEWAIDAGTPSFKECTGGKKVWQEAVDYVACLNSHNYLGHSDWRLPSSRELTRMVSKHAYHKYGVAGPELKKRGFKNVQPSLYWSSDLVTDEIALAVEVLMSGESTHRVGTSNTFHVWPVRGEKTGKKH